MAEESKKMSMKYVAVLVSIVMLGSCFGNLSQTALNSMFSGMAQDFGVDAGIGQWVTTLYMLVLGITVPAVTYLMKRFAIKDVVVGSLLLLVIGGVVDAIAWSFPVLIVGRVLQAVSAGITMPMMMSLIMTSVPPNRQATAMGISGIAMGFAPNIGPIIGGWMLETTGWRSFFVVLAFFSLVLVLCSLIFIKKTSAENESIRLDVVSLCQSALGFGGLLLGFSNASSFEFTSPFVWLPIMVGAAFLLLFVRRQHRVEEPLIHLEIFESEQFRVSYWAGNFLYASFMGITLIVPLFIENLWGGSAFLAGLALLPGTIAAFFINPLAGVLTDKIGARPVIVVASLFLATGATMMAFIDETTPYWAIFVMQGIRAIGVSGLIGPLSSWGMAKLPPRFMTDASSFSTAVRQAFASLGTALMVFALMVVGPAIGSVEMGYHLGFGISAACAIAVVIIAVVSVRSNMRN